jgi:WD40 repeat protein
MQKQWNCCTHCQASFRWNQSVLFNDRSAHSKSVRSLCFSQDSTLLFSGSADCMICVWDVKSLAARRSLSLVATLEGHAGWVTSMAVRSDNKLLASGSTDGTAKIWDLSRLTSPLANIKEYVCSFSCAMFVTSRQVQRDLERCLETSIHYHFAAI